MTGSIMIVLFAILILGVALSARSRTPADYFLASRQTTSIPLIASYVSTSVGGGTLVAFTAIAFQAGISAFYLGVGYAFGFMLFRMVVPKIRELANRHDLVSMSDFVRHFYGSDRLEWLVTATVILAYLLYLAVQVLGISYIVGFYTGISGQLAIVAAGMFVTFYSAFGGLKADIRTDLVQFIIMLLVVSALIYFIADGRIPALDFTALPASHLRGDGYHGYGFVVIAALTLGPSFVASMDSWQKAISAKDDATVRRSLTISGIMLVLLFSFFAYIGTLAYQIDPGAAPELALATVARQLPEGALFLVTLLFIAGITSTSDSMLVAIVTTLFNNRFTAPKTTRLRSIRLATFAVGIFVMLIALVGGDIVSLVSNAVLSLAILLPVVAAPLLGWVSERAAFYSLSISLSIAFLFLAVSPALAFISAVISAFTVFTGVFLFQRFRRRQLLHEGRAG